jgi:death-on-curing protein
VKAIRFLSAEQVIEMHNALLERWGGDEGGGHRGAAGEGPDAAVQAVKNSYYETIEELAAACAVHIVQGHVFLDGNKRAGAAAMLVFLEANGRRVSLASEQIAGLMLELQQRSEAGEDARRLIRWLAGFLRRKVPATRLRLRRRTAPRQ